MNKSLFAILIVCICALVSPILADPTCNKCKSLTATVRKEVLEFDADYNKVAGAVRVACYLDPKITDKCDEYLNKLDTIMNLIVKGVSDEHICEQLHLCDNGLVITEEPYDEFYEVEVEEVENDKVLMIAQGLPEEKKEQVEKPTEVKEDETSDKSVDFCTDCKVLTLLSKISLEVGVQIDEIKEIIDSICAEDPSMKECTTYSKSIQQVISWIKEGKEYDEICENLNFCSSDYLIVYILI